MTESAENVSPPGQKKLDVDELDKYLEKKIKGLKKVKNEFKFKNLVFNGGGAKCIGQIGTLEVFEKLDLMKNITRFAGTSGGALTAAFAALGYEPDDIKSLLQENLDNIVKGQTWARWAWNKLTVLYNIFWRHGVHTGTDVENWLGDVIAKAPRSGNNRDVTFKQLYEYEESGEPCHIELVVTAINIVRRYCVYYHVKTYPDMPIRKALRMSMSIPGYFTPVNLKQDCPKKYMDQAGLFVDGGLLCNYPVMCFDGWYLSMEVEGLSLLNITLNEPDPDKDFDSSDSRFRPNKEKYNKETVGVMVYSDDDEVFFRTALDEREMQLPGQKIPAKTDLGREGQIKFNKNQAKRNEMDEKVNTMQKWLKFMQKVIKEQQRDEGGISKEGLIEMITLVRTFNKVREARVKNEMDDEEQKQTLEKLRQELYLKPNLRKVAQEMDQKKKWLETINEIPELRQVAISELEKLLVRAEKQTNVTPSTFLTKGKLTHALWRMAYSQNANESSIEGTDARAVPTRDEFYILFGVDITKLSVDRAANIIFKEFGVKDGGELQFNHIHSFAARQGCELYKEYRMIITHDKRHVSTYQYMEGLFNTMIVYASRPQLKAYDKDRTIGINTGYLQTLDFEMEDKDKRYLINQGKLGTVVFLLDKMRNNTSEAGSTETNRDEVDRHE